MRIHTIGGFNEVGKNMTAVEVGEDVFLFDAGLFLPPIVELEEREGVMEERKLRAINAIPDDLILDSKDLRRKVRAILVGHAHLDHVGAVPYIAERYNAEIYGTPFTTAVLKTLMADEKKEIKNPIRSIQPNSNFKVKCFDGKEKEIDFVNITHSTIQTSLMALHTKEGVVLYANDFKFDNSPQLGNKPNYEKLKELQKEGVKALIVDSLYASEERKTPSEKVARTLLEDVLLTTDNSKSAIIVTTFSSHIARLKSIVDFGKKLDRKIVFVGRSLNKYVGAAIKENLCPFQKDISVLSYRKQIEAGFRKINKNKDHYLIVCTGHQGEPGSILDRISKNETPLELSPRDHVIFSSKTIPAEINIANKSHLEKRLKQKGVRIFNDVHVSGHAGREDLRDFINLVQPEHIIPAHGELAKLSSMAELAHEMGYSLGKTCHLSPNLHHVDL